MPRHEIGPHEMSEAQKSGVSRESYVPAVRSRPRLSRVPRWYRALAKSRGILGEVGQERLFLPALFGEYHSRRNRPVAVPYRPLADRKYLFFMPFVEDHPTFKVWSRVPAGQRHTVCFSGALQSSLIHNEDVQVIEVENILFSCRVFLGIEALEHPHDGTTVDAVELSSAYDLRQKGSG